MRCHGGKNIRCWGANRFGPVRAVGFTDVATGATHSCGGKLDGTVQCWGRFREDQTTPPTDDLGDPIRFSSLDSQDVHTCGLRADDDGVVCWGQDNWGQSSGQPPANSSQHVLDNSVSYDYSDDAFSQISAGKFHTCGVLKDGPNAGHVRCWGSNVSEETAVPAEHLTTVFKSVEAGAQVTCGLIGTAPDNGEVVCWGGGNSESRYSLVTKIPENVTFATLSIGDVHACGIKFDGTAFGWIADVNPDDPYLHVGQADMPATYRTATFSEIIVGLFHTCGILDHQNGQTEGEVVCWGAEFDYDSTKPHEVDGGRTTPPDFFYPPTSRFPELDTGIYYNCALTQCKDIICWGGSALSRPVRSRR